MPADSDEGEPQLEQRRLGRTSAAPVGDGVVDSPVPAGHVDRSVDLDRRAVLHPPGIVARCTVEIHDFTVPRITRVDFAIDNALQALVLSHPAEALSI